MAPSKVLAEYAKSGRSSCKGCGNTIGSDSLRVGSAEKDPRGFEKKSWFHLDCFPAKLSTVGSVEEIVGFSSLKSADKEALMKIKSGASSSDGTKGIKRDNADKKESDESHVKKPKVSSDLKEINFSESEVKDKYKDANLAPNWKAFSTVIFREREEGLNDSAKIAAFDFDGCLANTNVRKVGADAWSLMYPTIPDKLKELYNDGYKLVIFTNEANIERWKNKRQQAVDSKIGRLNNFIKLVNLPIQVFIACGTTIKEVQDPFRKPNPGLWKLMEQHFNSQISIDYDQSFYVGDAAGRDNDHSDADIEFAKANGLKFFVPEEYFDVE
ncbi:hypothetical protein LUZ60_000567 [Juncus effusus]|nr:hypothetical protein LUZ60_000567 [Juncus effusus]